MPACWWLATIMSRRRARSTSSASLAHLPPKMRNAILSTKVEGLSAAEAAERAGMSETAIKVSVHRGLKTLANLVGGKAR